ncbi:MAG: DUF3857 domain-containing protein [Pyrinomonadaceae bacterium]
MFQQSLTKFFVGCLMLGAFNCLARGAGNDSVPNWLTQAAAQNNPGYDKDVPAVVLYNEQIATISADGMLTTTTNYAVRLLKREGKPFADAGVFYLQSASKVRDFKGWLIRSGNPVKVYGKDQITDIISDPDDIYNEGRVKTIDASDDADVGAVFGYQSVVEEKPLFLQDTYAFQNRLPTLDSRYTLSLPTGWTATSITFNREEIKPQISGTNYTWELRDLSPIPPEPDSPNPHTLAPRVVVNYFPNNGTIQNFKTWQDVSQWYTDLSQPSFVVDDLIAGKARELTANAKTELEKIQTIAKYVQNIRYISLDIGVSRGGGHRPRSSALVMERGYGDCKDKANLMRAMLSALKIESYLVLIYSGDPTFVREEWASPNQFNHCIIAVKVGDETITPTVIKHETLGRLMIFDATDPYTLVGDLPGHEQGSFALVSAGKNGKLMRMPVLPPESNRLERQAEAELLPDGSLKGSIHEQAYGQTASNYRGESRALSAAQYKTRKESWLSNRLSGAKMANFNPADRPTENRFDIGMDFSANAYAQLMQGRLMVFKPAFVGRLDQLIVSDGKRYYPVLLEASAYNETIKVRLPEGFIVDEIPETGKVETAFAKYTVSYEVKEGFLLLNRSLTVSKSTVAADKYDSVKTFFAQVRAAESNPVVLMKK